jgi:hypothetical protein
MIDSCLSLHPLRLKVRSSAGEQAGALSLSLSLSFSPMLPSIRCMLGMTLFLFQYFPLSGDLSIMLILSSKIHIPVRFISIAYLLK